MSEMNPTPGPWTVLPEEDDKDYIRIRGTKLGCRYKIANVHMPKHWESHDVLRDREDAESRSNARLIAEAGTVFHETGLSPRQLVEMNAELVDALKDCANVCAGENTTKAGLVRALEKARTALTKASASSISKGVE
jgi:hypothetical protein